MTLWVNRLIILLGWVGVFIAGVMSYSKATNLLVPCSQGISCAVVGFSKYSALMNVPVAYLGLAAYVTLTALATLRALSPQAWSWTARVGLWMSVGGFLFSTYLTYMSLTELRTTCEWCLGSLATMTGMFLAHALVVRGNESPTDTRLDWSAFAVGSVIALAGFGYNTGLMGQDKGGKPLDLGKLSVEDVIGPAYKRKGNADAKVTLVEFADFNCPSCRTSKPTIDALYVKYGGRLRVSYRSFPLNIPGHESSMLAARMAEVAGQKGKYWQFVDKVFEAVNTQRIKDADGVGLRQVATEVGIDAKELNAALDNDNDPSVGAVVDDMGMAMKSLRLTGTPSFILLGTGVTAKLVKHNELDALLDSQPYKGLLAK